MSSNRFDDDEDEDDRKDSEFTLGLGSLLGIFFALVLLCGLFFGFGYTLGHGKSPLHVKNPSAATPEAPPAGAASAQTPTGSKPAATQSAPPPAPAQPDSGQPATGQSTNGATTPSNGSSTTTGNQPAATQPPPANGSNQSAAQSAPRRQTVTPGVAQQVFQAAVPRAPAQMAATNQYMVQIAAVSRPQDANVLVAALQQHGFHAVSRSEPQDHLLHIQIGPFATLAQANQMRARLRAEGYNAILKP